MALVNKTTLKGYFKEGDRPNEDTFEDVFDSVMSIHSSNNETVAGDTTFSGTTTFTGAFSIVNDTIIAAGAGVSGAQRNTWTVSKADGHTTTVGLLDIQGLTSDATNTGAIGNEGGAAAYFAKIRKNESGYVYFAGITCIETPQGGELDIDLVFDTTNTAEGVAVTDVIIPTGANWTAGATRNSYNQGGAHVALTGGLHNHYLYLAVGTSSSPTNGTYTHGKFAIVLKGHDSF